MSELPIEVVSVAQRFEENADGDPQFLSDLLFFPELSTFGADPLAAREGQLEIAGALLAARPPDEVMRRHGALDLREGAIEIQLAPSPARHGRTWLNPATIHLAFIRWRHGRGHVVAYVPALGIQVIARTDERLEARLPDEIQAAILREGFANSLLDLTYLDRGGRLEIASGPWPATPKTPTEDHQAQIGAPGEEESVLDEVATRLVPRRMPRAWERDDLVRQLAALLAGRRKASVLLVGPAGVGKTAIVHELVRTRSRHPGLQSRQFFRSGGSRLVAGMLGFGMWQERCRRIVNEAGPRRAILHLGSLFELMEVGQSTASSESIASFLRPYLVRGQLVAIAECTPEQLSVIEKRDPKLLDAFRQLQVPEPSPAAARAILASVVGNAMTDAALEKADGLHRRYSSYSAFPGRPLRFLDRLVGHSPRARADGSSSRHQGGGSARARSRRRLETRDVLEAFSRETGMPEVLLSRDKPLDLDGTRNWFRERIAGQDAAVDLVIDTLATIKANLNRPGKPLASFLFIGPTGVGKTELAKVLAEFLYGSRDRMIRLDMSEFNLPGSAGRLVSESGIGGKEGLLTAKVREQPFSVILLDEFEKADPAVFDLFLQVLGEARLTDAAGRVADFTNSVIIMTSNLGAREFQRGPLGFGSDPLRDAIDHFTSAVRRTLRPELFNRIDRILPFAPLPREMIGRIIQRELAEIATRDGLAMRGIEIAVDPDLLTHFIDEGYDPRYGARPLKRAVERLLLHPLSRLLASSRRGNQVVSATLAADGTARLEWRDRREPSGTAPTSRAAASKAIEAAADIRRRALRLAGSPLVSSLDSEHDRLGQRLRPAARATGKKADTISGLSRIERRRLGRLEKLLARVRTAAEEARRAEEHCILSHGIALPARSARIEDGADDNDSPEPRLDRAALDALLVECYLAAESAGDGDAATLLVTADSQDFLAALARSYLEVARSAEELEVVVFRYPRHPESTVGVEGRPACAPVPVPLQTILDPEAELPADTGALALGLHGPGAAVRFATEPGLHRWTDADGGRAQALVGLLEAAAEGAVVLLDDLHHPGFDRFPVRRQFDDPKRSVRDTFLGRKRRALFSSALVRDLLEASLMKRATDSLG